jgi:hypothetical protein
MIRLCFLIVITGACLLRSAPAQAQAHWPTVERTEVPQKPPAPRPHVDASRVLPSSALPPGLGVEPQLAYTIAREIPQILDGLPSYCHSGRSLLSCFESEAALQASYSRTVAELAYVLARQGHDLAYIRQYVESGVPIEAE